MQFERSEIHEELEKLARKFAVNEILPLAEADEKSETFRPELIAKMGELGLTGIPTPEAYGGSGMGYLEYTSIMEELGATSAAYAVSVGVSGLPQLILSKFGTEEQKKKYIPPLASGKAIGAFCLSEASSGSDAGSLRTSAKLQGDHYIINGTKLWITQGDVAETLILMARTGQDGPKGVSAFILEKGMPGLELGKREEKMGLQASHTYELVLKDVKVPKENLIDAEGKGFTIAMTALDSGRITIGACSVGVARGAYEAALQYSKEREQFGKPIASFQGVSFMLADMLIQIDAARLMVQRAAWLRDNGKPFTAEAAMAKTFASDTAMKVTTDAVQVLGGAGYTRDFPVERYMRESKVMQIFEGTNQIQRYVIARGITGVK